MTATDIDKPGFAERFVLRALVVSVFIHLLAYGTYRIGEPRGWWTNLTMPRWMQAVTQALTPQMPKKLVTPIVTPQTELRFVQVDPANAQPEAPKVPKYYSSQNTFAANPNVTKPSAVPDIRGKQDKVLKTTDNGKPKAQPLKPTPTTKPEVQPTTKPVEASTPKKEYAPGDLVSAKPAEAARDGDGTAETKTEAQKAVETQPEPVQQHPRSIAEGMERLGMQGGPPMRQTGGVKRPAITSQLDVAGSAVGKYDDEFVDAVSARWTQLWDGHSPNGSGKVVLEFRLHPDGRITDMKVGQTEVTELMTDFCKQAIFDPAPFKPWPREMRLEIPTDYRDIQFTFYYEIE